MIDFQGRTAVVTGTGIGRICWCFFLWFFIGVCFPLDRAVGQTDFLEKDKNLAALIQQVKTGVVAIGTYHFNDKPAVRFSGTGFATGDGTRIATGEVVGVINMVFVKGKKEHVLKDPTGITYAIPVTHVHALEKTHDAGGSN